MTFKKATMERCGVAWFGFDSNSARPIDKLSRCIETIEFTDGKPEAVNGWNDIGFAIKNSNNTLGKINNPLATVNEGTYRFKFKVNNGHSSGGTIATNIIHSTREHFKFEMTPSGNIQVYVRPYNGTAIRRVSSEEYNDGKWHDFILTYGYNNRYLSMELILDEKERINFGATYFDVNPMVNIPFYFLGEPSLSFNDLVIDDLQLLSEYLPTDKSDQFLDRRYFSLDLKGTDKFLGANNSGIRYGTGNGNLGLNRIDMPNNINTHGFGIFREIDKANDSDSINLKTKHSRVTTTSNNFLDDLVSGEKVIKMPAFSGKVIGYRPNNMDFSNGIGYYLGLAIMYKGQVYTTDDWGLEEWINSGATVPVLSHFRDTTTGELYGKNIIGQFEKLADFDPLDIYYLIIPQTPIVPLLFYQITTEPSENKRLSFEDLAGYQEFSLNVYVEEDENSFKVEVQAESVPPQELIQKVPITLSPTHERFKVMSAIGTAKYGVSFDDKVTWKTFRNGQFETISTLSEGEAMNTMESIDELDWDTAIGSSTSVTFGYWLEEDSFVSELVIFGATDEYEGIADTDKYDVIYNPSTKTATVTFKQSGRFRLNYQDSIVPFSSEDNKTKGDN